MLNQQELTNELIIWITSYFLLVFSDWIDDTAIGTHTNLNIKTGAGRTMLVFIIVNVAINFLIVGRVGVNWIRLRIKRYLQRKERLQKLELKAKMLKKTTSQVNLTNISKA